MTQNNINVNDVRDNSASAKAPKRIVRKYDRECIKFGFTKARSDAEPIVIYLGRWYPEFFLTISCGH